MSVTSFNFRSRQRRGSALLLCTLAIAVISVASIGILRSHQRGLATVEASRISRQSRHTTDGLYQRAIAAIRLNPATAGSLSLPKSTYAGARLEVKPISATATQVEVYLYDKSKTPAGRWIVDPTKLSGATKPPVRGNPLTKI